MMFPKSAPAFSAALFTQHIACVIFACHRCRRPSFCPDSRSCVTLNTIACDRDSARGWTPISLSLNCTYAFPPTSRLFSCAAPFCLDDSLIDFPSRSVRSMAVPSRVHGKCECWKRSSRTAAVRFWQRSNRCRLPVFPPNRAPISSAFLLS